MQTAKRDKRREKLAIFQFVDQTQFNSLYPPLTLPDNFFLIPPHRLLFLSESYSAGMQNTRGVARKPGEEVTVGRRYEEGSSRKDRETSVGWAWGWEKSSWAT